MFLFGLLLFACMDTTTKYLAARHDVPLIVAVRYIVNLLLMLAMFGPAHGRQLVTTRRTGLVLVRAGALAAASLLVGLALQRMPLAETTALTFLSPFLVVILAGPLLGERTGIVGWIAAILGFAGTLLIVRPGSGLDPAGIAFVAAAIGAGATYQLLSRVLVSTERTIALLFYTALVGSIAFGITIPFSLDGEWPGAFEMLLLASCGVYGGVGHYLFTAAYREAPASTLAPMLYCQLIWAGLLGWLVFGQVPDMLGLLGMLIIAGAGATMALRSRGSRVPIGEPVD